MNVNNSNESATRVFARGNTHAVTQRILQSSFFRTLKLNSMYHNTITEVAVTLMLGKNELI